MAVLVTAASTITSNELTRMMVDGFFNPSETPKPTAHQHSGPASNANAE